jgi:hypothetical protein
MSRIRQTIVEQIAITPQTRVDAEAGIIHDVKILGASSANKRRYTEKAVESGRSLYEGLNCNVDHPADPRQARACRSAYDRFGWLEGCKPQGGELYGDLHLLKTHRITPVLLEAAQKRPQTFGLSHNADGEGYYDKDGTFVVESLPVVRSVDLVADPATTKSLFESIQPMTKKLRQVIAEAAVRPEVKKILEDMADTYQDLDMPAEGAPGDKPEDHKQHLVNAVGCLLKSDKPEHHDMAGKIARLMRPEGKGDEDDEDEDVKKRKAAGEPMPKEETREAKQARIKGLCDLAGFEPAQPVLESLCLLPTDAAAITMIKQLKSLAAPQPTDPFAPGQRQYPRSTGPIPEAKNGAEGAPKVETLPRGDGLLPALRQGRV